MSNQTEHSLVLPVGFRKFCKNQFINYQLNRWFSEGYADEGDLFEAGRRIKRLSDSKPVFLDLAKQAKEQKRLAQAASYLRAAEFLTDPSDPDKKSIYKDFRATFTEAHAQEGVKSFLVPFEGGFLPVHRLEPEGGASAKGTIVLFGGFDSLIEEFYCYWKHFADCGYEVYAFEGPGQGGALLEYGLTAMHDWEKPTSVVLDYFGIEACTLLGISFGGYWCVRAAAFEPRIKNLIVHAPFYDLMEAQSPKLKKFVDFLVRHPGFLNWSIRLRMRIIPVIKHTVQHALHILGTPKGDPATIAPWLLGMNKHHIHSEKVRQHCLLLAGEKDRFQPLALYHLQKAALVNAASVTGRVFTKAEHAQNHCQMGNLGLALRVMTEWLDQHN